jgi:hypothetical protein
MGRFYDPVRGRCVRARPEVCEPGRSDKFSYGKGSLDRLRQLQRLEKLELLEKGPRVVCYLTSWAMYRKGEGKFVPEHLDARLCTDVVYAFAGLSPETLTVQPFDPWSDIDNSEFPLIASFLVILHCKRVHFIGLIFTRNSKFIVRSYIHIFLFNVNNLLTYTMYFNDYDISYIQWHLVKQFLSSTTANSNIFIHKM